MHGLGKVEIEFVITATGRVRSVAIQNDDFKDGVVSGCIAALAFTWRFPEAPGGGEIKVDFPFEFMR